MAARARAGGAEDARGGARDPHRRPRRLDRLDFGLRVGRRPFHHDDHPGRVVTLARAPVIAWIAGIAACIVVVARTEFSADLSAFLPRSPSPEQQVLVEQLRE